MLKDKYIECDECGKEFLFCVKEQDFFLRKDFEDPKRCKECRKERKLKNQEK